MALLTTPVCDFGLPAIDFSLPGVDGKSWTLQDCKGERGLVVIFLSNHCPYVQAIRKRLVQDTRELLTFGVHCVGIMANDTVNYPEDSFENMARVAREFQFPFPYLYDQTQAVARAYGAVCTPDFFGYNAALGLQYRGRLDATSMKAASPTTPRELVEAMKQVAATGVGPTQQTPSMGCSIKWRSDSE